MIDLSQLDGSSPVSYLIAVPVPALDAILPVLPGETAVIALGVASPGHADVRIAVLAALAACGAFIGDNLAYLPGRRFGPAAELRFFAGDRGARRRVWAPDRFGARIIIGCRFIPGGRTAVTLTCGMVGYRRRNFAAATAVADGIWAAYAFFIGRLAGEAFEDKALGGPPGRPRRRARAQHRGRGAAGGPGARLAGSCPAALLARQAGISCVADLSRAGAWPRADRI
jgi:membrane-associated protein